MQEQFDGEVELFCSSRDPHRSPIQIASVRIFGEIRKPFRGNVEVHGKVEELQHRTA